MQNVIPFSNSCAIIRTNESKNAFNATHLTLKVKKGDR